MRQVVFLTDGAVGNEDEILRLVHDQLGDRRLFTIGIGPAPNTFFLTKAAQFGRGTFTFIGDVREVKEKMTALFRKLESPALTDIAVDWPGGTDAWPRLVPDLYAGEPVVVTAQFPAGTLAGQRRDPGKRAGTGWQALLPVNAGAPEPGVAVLWARAKIDALMDAGRQGAPEAGHSQRGARRRAHASPGQQVHEPGRGRRDADEARGRRRHQDRNCPATFRKG